MKGEKDILKSNLHPLNKHRGLYNFKELIESHAELRHFVKPNKYGNESVDFFDPKAVKALNTALLKHFYGIDFWDIPQNYLCPPIPGRADYIHHIADLIKPKTDNVKCLDIGVGANCIYPIIGVKEYGWQFVGTEIDPIAIKNANEILNYNVGLKDSVELRLQENSTDIFSGMIKKDEYFDLSICNPPFHISAAAARQGTTRKLKNLTGKKTTKPTLNFGGKNSELWCKGGEERFVRDMIFESSRFANSCNWFTTLISKQDRLESVYRTLETVNARKVKTINMGTGNKISRIVAWSF